MKTSCLAEFTILIQELRMSLSRIPVRRGLCCWSFCDTSWYLRICRTCWAWMLNQILNPSWDFESNSFLGRIALNSEKLGETWTIGRKFQNCETLKDPAIFSHVYLQTLSPTSYTRRDNFWTPVDTVESLENLSNLSTSWFSPLPFKPCKNKFVWAEVC